MTHKTPIETRKIPDASPLLKEVDRPSFKLLEAETTVFEFDFVETVSVTYATKEETIEPNKKEIAKGTLNNNKNKVIIITKIVITLYSVLRKESAPL
jgi:hypothetical protein